MLVRAVHVALNPYDWRVIDMLDVNGCIVGCDFSRLVEAVSEGPVTSNFSLGDRIIGTARGI